MPEFWKSYVTINVYNDTNEKTQIKIFLVNVIHKICYIKNIICDTFKEQILEFNKKNNDFQIIKVKKNN